MGDFDKTGETRLWTQASASENRMGPQTESAEELSPLSQDLGEAKSKSTLTIDGIASYKTSVFAPRIVKIFGQAHTETHVRNHDSFGPEKA